MLSPQPFLLMLFLGSALMHGAAVPPQEVVAAASPEAATVLILVNDAVPKAAGTDGKGASVWVGETYAKRRGVPFTQILHLNIPLGCCDNNPLDWDSWNGDWTKFDTTIRQPVKKFLARNGLADKIRYIVTTYGIPLRTWDVAHKIEGLSVDSFLAAINSGLDVVPVRNPYYLPLNLEGRHIADWQSPAPWRMYLVTRLDGPTPQIAAGLVDKAIRAEVTLKPTDGIGYYDWRHNTDSKDPYYVADQTMLNAYNIAQSLGFKSVLNDNHNDSAKMIHSAPRALWAWGWYSGPVTWEGYEFVEGAVGAQFTSYSAVSVRTMIPGTWVPLWLKAGITATWGATSEPYVWGYASGDILLKRFWSGFNFAESAYMASPVLNHMMVFVGDPLYAPRIFQGGKAAQEANQPQSPVLESKLAELMGQKKFNEARVLLDDMLKANPGSPDVLFLLGLVNLADSKFKEAEDAFQRVYQLNPANLRGLLGLVETLMAQNKPEEALKLLQTESDKTPDRVDLLLALGNTAVRAGKYDFAIQTFNKVLGQVEKGSKQGDIYLRIGESYRRKGDSNGAVQALQKARECLPDDTRVLSTLAMVLDGAGRRPEAKQVYEATLKLDPSNAVALNNLAFLLAETGGDLDDALTKAQRAKQLLPNLYEISDTLGWIYLKKNLSDQAIDTFKELVSKEPFISTYHFHLGMAYSQKGDKTKALDQLREALKCNPLKEEKEKIQRMIEGLGSMQ
jgi:uncharacterized protein (TIGR03790 family)